MFAVIVIRQGRADPRDFATGDRLLDALTPFDQADLTGVWTSEKAIIAQALTWNTPESKHETAPTVCPDTGRVIASWVRLDNREDLCAALKLENRETLTDPQIILAAHRAWGEDCADRLEGDFSFVIYDPDRHEVFCARDAIGVKPLYYVLTDTYFLASTTVAAFRAAQGLDLSPNLKWMALFAAFLNLSHRNAAYDGVGKLPAAHTMLVKHDAVVEPAEYFSFDLVAPHALRRDQKWVDAYRAAFDHAINVRTRTQYLIGAESSAGLDSSSIVARLAATLPHDHDDFHCFGRVAFEDEPALMLLTAAKCDVRHSHILTAPEELRIDDAFFRALTAIGHPPEHPQVFSNPTFFQLAEHLGIRSFYSGFGGDEVVTSYAPYLVEELWDQGHYIAAFNELPGRFAMQLARAGKKLWNGPNHPWPNLRDNIQAKLSISCIRTDFLEDSGLQSQIEEWAFPPLDKLSVNSVIQVDPFFRLARTGRLESEAIYANSHRLEYRYPMFDRTLLKQFFATPSIEKRHRAMGRYLHRRALAGSVPDRILWQQSKSMGNYIGGKVKSQTVGLPQFDTMPAALRSIIDRTRYEDLQSQITRLDGQDSNQRNLALMFAWQIRQLSEWLEYS